MRTDPMRRETGASLVFVIIVVLALVGLFSALRALSRWTASTDEAGLTNSRLQLAATALDQYVANVHRLPCPADPTLDSGTEPSPPNSYSCAIEDGTLPWATIGLRRDDSFDGWGWKISYRVYSAAGGSLVQAEGASMVLCDTVELYPKPPTSGATGGQCQPTKDTMPGDYATPNTFLAGKGLTVSDFGVIHKDAAYVLISHGPTGYGGYTTSGARKPMPNGADERGNTKAAGPFTARNWSDPDVTVTSGTHFDDVLLYRSVADVVKNANLGARDWPEPSIISAIVLDSPSIGAAGNVVAPDLGTTISFSSPTSGTTTITASGGISNHLSLSSSGGTEGVGVVGVYFNPLTLTNVGNFLTNAGNEYIRVALPRPAQQFAVTLDNFGYKTIAGNQYTERAQFVFKRVGVPIASTVASACSSDRSTDPSGGLASYSLDVGSASTIAFDSVDITPLSTAESSLSPSFFLVSEVAACDPRVTCSTGLANAQNSCAAPTITAIPAAVITAAKSISSTSGPSPSAGAITISVAYSNIGNLAATSVFLNDTIPAGMVYVPGSGRWSVSGTGYPGGTALTDDSDGIEQSSPYPPGIDYSFDAVSGTVSAIIPSVLSGASGQVTFQVTIAAGVTSPQSISNIVSFGTATQPSNNTNTVIYTVTP